MQVYDIVFVGAGLSSSSTLYHILSNLKKENSGQPKSIAVIEKNKEFFKGIAYGNRTSIHSLTINPIKDFLEDQEAPVFFDWLNKLKAKNWGDTTDAQKEVLDGWVQKNSDNLNAEGFAGVYIPRFLYGIYLTGMLKNIVAECKALNVANVDLIGGEAVDATKTTDGHYILNVQTDDKKITLTANLLVLGTGSLDTRKITTGLQSPYLCIDDVYSPTLEINLQKLWDALDALEPKQRNIMIIGSNASASEMVHILCKKSKDKQDSFNKIFILSTSGLPDRLHVNSDYSYLLDNLQQLEDAGNYTADALMLAIIKDVANAKAQGLSVGKIHYSLSDKVVNIQKKFSAEEAMRFFDVYGWPFTRITRRTSEDYYFTEQELAGTDKLEFIKGRFVKLCDDQSNADGLSFVYTAAGETDEKVFDTAFPIIINCAGAETISDTTSPLLRNMLDKGILQINRNKMGLAVNEDFSANDNIYIIGPSIAGIYNSKFKFWHLENAKRINMLAKVVSGIITEKLV